MSVTSVNQPWKKQEGIVESPCGKNTGTGVGRLNRIFSHLSQRARDELRPFQNEILKEKEITLHCDYKVCAAGGMSREYQIYVKFFGDRVEVSRIREDHRFFGYRHVTTYKDGEAVTSKRVF